MTALGALPNGDEPTSEEAEFFPTPKWAVDRIIERILPDLCALDILRPHVRWVDPCVGGGALPDAVDTHIAGIDWTTWDIRDTGRAQHVGDWIKQPAANDQRADACIMNPPFSLALQFAAKAVRLCRVVIMLQRLNWLATKERREWLDANWPSPYVLPNRIDFDGRGGDNQEYAWFVWGLESRGGVLALTPADVRAAQKPARGPVASQLDLFEGAA